VARRSGARNVDIIDVLNITGIAPKPNPAPEEDEESDPENHESTSVKCLLEKPKRSGKEMFKPAHKLHHGDSSRSDIHGEFNPPYEKEMRPTSVASPCDSSPSKLKARRCA
jgi:hypothetical protein